MVVDWMRRCRLGLYRKEKVLLIFGTVNLSRFFVLVKVLLSVKVEFRR